MSAGPDGRIRISRTQFRWLSAQSEAWVASGVIHLQARQHLLDSYSTETAERRGLIALVLLGALMFGIGVLLLIGYNWDRIPRFGRVAILMASVALSFGASAVAYGRRHFLAADTLAFVGTLLFGNAIWLIAQVLHIQGDYPDAFLWWMIGTLVCSALLRSTAIGIGAAVLFFVWVAVAGLTPDRPGALFVLLWPVALITGYRVRSPVMLYGFVVSAALWSGLVPEDHQALAASIGCAALAGCAFCAIAAWHPRASTMASAWRIAGLVVLVVAFIPLLTSDLHQPRSFQNVVWPALWPGLLWFLLTLAIVAQRPARWTLVMGITAASIAAWLVLLGVPGLGFHPLWGRIATVGFSVLALALSVALIREALHSDHASDLAFGVLFGVIFMFVRWVSLIDNMLWSGLMLITAAAGVFVLSNLWRQRVRPETVGGLS